MKGKGVVKLLLVAVLLVVAAAPLVTSAACKGPKPSGVLAPLKIGVVLPLTGSGAGMGDPGDKGINVWIEDFNKKGGINGHAIEKYSADDESDATRATVVMKRLVESDGVAAVVGSNITGNVLAMQPIADEYGVLHCAVCGSEVYGEKPPKWNWGFRLNVDSQPLADALFVPIKEKYAATTVAHLYSSDAYGKRWMGIYATSCAKFGMTMVAEESYDPSGTMFSAVIAKTRAANPDFLLVTGNSIAGGLIIKQVREMGWDVPIGIQVPLATPSLVEAVGDYYCMEPGVWESGLTVDVWEQLPKDLPEVSEIKPLAELYKEKYGKELSFYACLPLAALKGIVLATKEALDADPGFLDGDITSIRLKIRDNFENLDPFWTVIGQYHPTKDWHNGYVYGTGMVITQFDPATKKLVAHPEYTLIK